MVTIVVLSQNPPQILEEKLKEQTYKDFEVIYAKEKGIVNAMNIALKKAQGDIFVRIDDDVILPPMWLEELVKPFSDKNIAGVTAPTIIPEHLFDNRDSIRISYNPGAFLKWMFDDRPFARAKIYNCGSVSYGSNFRDKMEYNYDIDHLEGTNWAMRTELIRKVGGFDPKFDGVAEWFDDDVVFKIKKLGYRLCYAPKAYLYHIISKGEHYEDRFEGWGRIKNWLRFHLRHSKFHYKKVIWLFLMTGYFLTRGNYGKRRRRILHGTDRDIS
jgi:GT2 family glycosyltransferase